MEKKRLKVYIASPYTNGSHADNVRRQLQAQKELMDRKFVAFAPLLSHFAEIYNPRPEHEWFSWDLEWLKTCDFLIRIRPADGDGIEVRSNGSDIEEQTAIDMNMPVYNFPSIDKLRYWLITYDADKIQKDINRLKLNSDER